MAGSPSRYGLGVFGAATDGVTVQIAAVGIAQRRTLPEPVTVTAAGPAAATVAPFLWGRESAASSGDGGLRVVWWPGEPGAERARQPGDRRPRGRPADLPGQPGAGEASRDDVRAGGDRGQAVLDIAERGTGAGGESQPEHLGAVHDVDVHVQVDRPAVEPGQHGPQGGGRGGDVPDLAGGEGVAFGRIEVPRV